MHEHDLPIYSIKKFNQQQSDSNFYANTLQQHLKKHHFIRVPHKHDFFLTVLFTRGTGNHEVDFTMYKIKPGYVFTLSPGQTHNWKLSDDVEGYIFFHSKNFYDQEFTNEQILHFPFFASIYNAPLIILKGNVFEKITSQFKLILDEYQNDRILKYSLLLVQIKSVYIELTRHYKADTTHQNQNLNYLFKVRKLESLIDAHFKELKYPNEYADKMNMSEKHLNRICKATLNKTTTQLITDRIILESKRLLMQTDFNVNQIAETLGYTDNSYFSRLFKKHTGQTPLSFVSNYQL